MPELIGFHSILLCIPGNEVSDSSVEGMKPCSAPRRFSTNGRVVDGARLGRFVSLWDAFFQQSHVEGCPVFEVYSIPALEIVSTRSREAK